MNETLFFCLAAKVRQAQKAYYADKTKGEEKQKKLVRSKQLEKLLDDAINERINSASNQEKTNMGIEWGNFVLCRQIDNIYI